MKRLDLTNASNLLVIGDAAFNNCSALETVKTGTSVKKINNGAFAYCKALKLVDFSQSTNLETIGDESFAYCFSLEPFGIPKSVTSFGENVFFYFDNKDDFEWKTLPNLKTITIIDGEPQALTFRLYELYPAQTQKIWDESHSIYNAFG